MLAGPKDDVNFHFQPVVCWWKSCPIPTCIQKRQESLSTRAGIAVLQCGYLSYICIRGLMVVSSVQFCDAQNQVIHLRNSPLTGSKCTARESLLRWWTWIVVPCCKDKHPLLGNQGMSRNYLHGRVTMGESQTAQSLWSSSNEVKNKKSIFHVCACFPLEHLTTNGRRAG